MGQSTEELASQIEDTRGRMASDLDTLQDRVSPSAIIERRKHAVRSRFGSMKNKVMGTAHSAADAVPSGTAAASTVTDTASDLASGAQERFEGAPLAAGLVAFGAGLVVASLVPSTRVEAEAAHQVVETAKEHGQPLVDQARAAGEELMSGAKDNAAQAAQQVRDSAQESMDRVKEEGATAGATVKDAAGN